MTSVPNAAGASLAHLPRLPDWQLRLQGLVSARARMVFAWGVHDCCLFAADAVQAIVGHDPAAAYRGQYGTQQEAERILAALGGLRGLASATLGEAIPARMARPGDIVLMGAGMGMPDPALGVCNGATTLGPGARFLMARATADGVCAWRVGCA